MLAATVPAVPMAAIKKHRSLEPSVHDSDGGMGVDEASQDLERANCEDVAPGGSCINADSTSGTACAHWFEFRQGFPVVCQALQAELVASEGLRDVRVYFVCGADHWKKCRLHRGMPGDLGLVVLPRDGVRARSDPKKRIVVASSAPPDVSSTRIRRCLEGRGPLHEGMLPPAVEEYLRECPLPPPE